MYRKKTRKQKQTQRNKERETPKIGVCDLFLGIYRSYYILMFDDLATTEMKRMKIYVNRYKRSDMKLQCYIRHTKCECEN